MANRIALQVCLVHFEDNELLYVPPEPGASYDPTDTGRSSEYYALQAALARRYQAPLPPLALTYSTSSSTVITIDDDDLPWE